MLVLQYLFRVYIGQFQRFQLGEYNLQPQLITPSANLLKEMKKTVSYMPNTTGTRPQMVMDDEVQTQNDAVKTWEYLNDARVYSLSFCSSFYLIRHVA